MACEERVQEAERKKQQEIESKEKCEKKIRNTSNLFHKGLDRRLLESLKRNGDEASHWQ